VKLTLTINIPDSPGLENGLEEQLEDLLAVDYNFGQLVSAVTIAATNVVGKLLNDRVDWGDIEVDLSQ